jgi:hypothetical protein
VLGLSAKICLKAFRLVATLDSRVIFIILIIILNLHDSSLSESGCNTGSKSLQWVWLQGRVIKVWWLNRLIKKTKKKNQHEKKTNEEKEKNLN